MRSFLERFFDEVADNLADPASVKRFTKDKLLRDLYTIQTETWERLLGASGQESTLGYSEAEITIKDGVAFYSLPGNFRQFLKMERRQDGDRNRIQDVMRTIHTYQQGPGMEILSGQQGFVIRPEPNLSENQTWTLIYQKSDVPVHYAKAKSVTARSIEAGEPGQYAGTRYTSTDFYKGSILRIYQAEIGAPQSREVSKYTVHADGTATYQFRVPLSPVPSGDVWYEIAPALPEPYDSIYAMDVAILNTARRTQIRRASGLKDRRRSLWSACQSYFSRNTADRAPTRLIPDSEENVDPYESPSLYY